MKFPLPQLSLGYYQLKLNQLNAYLSVVIDDTFLLNILTTKVQIKNNSLFGFVYLFDVWVN